MRLDEAIATFEAWQRAAGRSPHTVSTYATHLAAWARTAFPDDDPEVDAVQPGDVQGFLGGLRELGRADATISIALSALRSFFGWCERQGLVERSPLHAVLRPSLASSVDDEYAFLDDVELDELLRTARDGVDGDARTPARRTEDFLLCTLMGLAGLRVSEVCALDVGDVGEEDVLVRSGKGRRRRRVPTDAVIWEAYRSHAPPGPHVFGMASDPRRRLTRNALEVRVARLGRAAGLPRVTPHVLRHSFATNTWRATQALVPLRDLLGHRSAATTNRYTHSRSEERRAVLAEARAARRRAVDGRRS